MKPGPHLNETLEELRRTAETDYRQEDWSNQHRALQEFLGKPRGNFVSLQNSYGRPFDPRRELAIEMAECRDRIRPLFPTALQAALNFLTNIAGTWTSDYGVTHVNTPEAVDRSQYQWAVLEGYDNILRALLVEAERRQRTASTGPVEHPVNVAAYPSGESGVEPGPVLDAKSRNVFRKAGDKWVVRFGGDPVYLNDTTGARYLALLLARPQVEIAAHDLYRDIAARPATPGSEEFEAMTDRELASRGLHVSSDLGSAGETTDQDAIKVLNAEVGRLKKLQTRAQEDGKSELCDKYAQQIADIRRQLRRDAGLRGRPRKAADSAGRARNAVSNAIVRVEDSLKNINPELWRHLRRSVRKGGVLVYRPDPPVSWDT